MEFIPITYYYTNAELTIHHGLVNGIVRPLEIRVGLPTHKAAYYLIINRPAKSWWIEPAEILYNFNVPTVIYKSMLLCCIDPGMITQHGTRLLIHLLPQPIDRIKSVNAHFAKTLTLPIAWGTQDIIITKYLDAAPIEMAEIDESGQLNDIFQNLQSNIIDLRLAWPETLNCVRLHLRRPHQNPDGAATYVDHNLALRFSPAYSSIISIMEEVVERERAFDGKIGLIKRILDAFVIAELIPAKAATKFWKVIKSAS